MLLRDLEQKIVKLVNESGLPIDAVYFIMSSLMREIEQKYNEYCREEDAAIAQSIEELDEKNEEASSEIEEPISAKNKE